jgi:hypothetical protein
MCPTAPQPGYRRTACRFRDRDLALHDRGDVFPALISPQTFSTNVFSNKLNVITPQKTLLKGGLEKMSERLSETALEAAGLINAYRQLLTAGGCSVDAICIFKEFLDTRRIGVSYYEHEIANALFHYYEKAPKKSGSPSSKPKSKDGPSAEADDLPTLYEDLLKGARERESIYKTHGEILDPPKSAREPLGLHAPTETWEETKRPEPVRTEIDELKDARASLVRVLHAAGAGRVFGILNAIKPTLAKTPLEAALRMRRANRLVII